MTTVPRDVFDRPARLWAWNLPASWFLIVGNNVGNTVFVHYVGVEKSSVI